MPADYTLIREQRTVFTAIEEVPNTGRDRLLARLKEVHVYPRYDFPPELLGRIDLLGFVRRAIKR